MHPCGGRPPGPLPTAELDDDQQAAIIDAMFERRVAAGEVVIR